MDDVYEPRTRDTRNRAPTNDVAETLALTSIAISLKRIADMMQKQYANKLLDELANMDLTPRS